MLSYQHAYHAGNLADVHKHAALSLLLHHMRQKEKPMTVMETHAGRGLYRVDDPESLKTGEAEAGIKKCLSEKWFAAGHPYSQCLNFIRAQYGEGAYPGSPLVSAHFLKPGDALYLMELHPAEAAALEKNMRPYAAQMHHRDGYEGVLALSPPPARRGLVLIDPSYEVKSEYEEIPGFVARLHKKWAQAVIMLWYPVLPAGRHTAMIKTLEERGYPKVLHQEIIFPSQALARGMRGSGVYCINLPFGLEPSLAEVYTILKGK